MAATFPLWREGSKDQGEGAPRAPPPIPFPFPLPAHPSPAQPSAPAAGRGMRSSSAGAESFFLWNSEPRPGQGVSKVMIRCMYLHTIHTRHYALLNIAYTQARKGDGRGQTQEDKFQLPFLQKSMLQASLLYPSYTSPVPPAALSIPPRDTRYGATYGAAATAVAARKLRKRAGETQCK